MATVPTIALDAMGGDYAPDEIVAGAAEALKGAQGQLRIVLVGQQPLIRRALERYGPIEGITIRHASESVDMAESVASLRRKKDSSLAVAIRMQKDGEADAMVSAGNTGAAMALSLLILGRIPGVSRPAIACTMPTATGVCTLLDVGANTTCKPEHLVQFAVMGSLYHTYAHSVARPRVGLLSIGEEASKGDSLVQETHAMLAVSSLNFIGNVEGRDILPGAADVVVCDGFTGNVVLKFAESAAQVIGGMIREAVQSSAMSRLGGVLIKRQFAKVKQRFDWEEYGGAPLLGIDGITIICHGRSKAKAIRNAIRVAAMAARGQLNSHIKAELEKVSVDATA